MDGSWDDWRVVYAAWTHGSFTAAAEALGVGQATVSRRVAAVEEALGHVLFDRHKTGLEPTAAARRLRPHLEALAAAAEGVAGALDGFEAEAVGEVRVAVPAGVAHDLMPALARRLAARHPGLHLEVLADIGPRDLARREADLAVRLMPTRDGDLLSRRLATARGGLFGTPALVGGLPAPLRPEDVPAVSYSHDLSGIPIARALEGLGVRVVFRSNDYLVLREAIAKGVGAGLLSEGEAARLGLVPVPLALPMAPVMTAYLVVHRALRHVPRVAAVIRAIDALIAEGAFGGAEAPAPGS